MNKLYCLIILLIACRICDAQNLVPNPSFEIFSFCPTYFGQVIEAVPWFQPTLGTSDYFNSCSMDVGVPLNYLGYQNARTGNAYAGFYSFFWYWPPYSYREYIEVPLNNPLIAGVTYYVNFYVSLSDSSNYTTNGIGAYFSTGSVTAPLYDSALPFVPQISDSNNISDKLNWTRISGTFTAIGGEDYLTIGNFLNDYFTDTVFIGGGDLSNVNYNASYYYIDDVCVSADSTYCLVSLGVEDIVQDENTIFFPSPFIDKLNIKIRRKERVEMNLYDATARIILNQSFSNSITINTEQLAKGIYLYEVRNKNGVIKKGKVVKN